MIVDRYISDTKLNELFPLFKNATFPIEKKWHDCFNAKLSDSTKSLTQAYQWRINRFSTRCANEVEGHPYIEDKPAEFEGSSQYRFHAKLYPKGEDKYKDNVSLYLRFDDYPENEVSVNYKFYIENVNGDKCEKQSSVFLNIFKLVFSIFYENFQ